MIFLSINLKIWECLLLIDLVDNFYENENLYLLIV